MFFKCKMCGGDIEIIENTNTGKCLYCKSTMTLPNLDDEKIINLYNRANDLRLENEFDKAYGIYEMILELDNNQVEAHWGLILCKYGVEYVDDPKTKKKIPTCHRTIINSILKERDFQFIKKNSYGEALKIYEQEAKTIDNIQKQILDISSKEAPYDVFICYKETDAKNDRTQDSVMAEDIYEALTKEGYKVFFARITLEDKLGQAYEPYIFSALTSSKVMLAIGTTTEHYESIWVKNEWSRYLEFMKEDKSKTLIPVYSKIDAYKLPEEFAMLQAQNMDKVGAMQDLIRGVKKILDASKGNKDIDSDVLKKVKAVLDEESIIGDDRYEVTEVKEKLPIWYYVLLLAATGITLFAKFIGLFDSFAFNLITRANLGIDDISKLLLIIQIISATLIFIAMIMKIKSRKLYLKANYLYFSTLFLESFSAIICLRKNSFVNIVWFVSVAVELILYFVNPLWHLDASSKVIVTKEEKDKLQEKNKNIRNNFTQKSKYIIKMKTFVICAAICIMIYLLYGFIHFKIPNGNKRDENVSQIKIIYDAVNFRSKMVLDDSYIIGIAYKDEIYTILDTEVSTNSYSRCLVWYKVKTNKGIKGYICGCDNNTEYAEALLLEEEKYEISNERDTSKKQLEITNSYLNIRENYTTYSKKVGTVYKGNIFTILDEKKEYNDKKWYKIETSNGITGWVSGEYVKIYKKEVK